MRDQLNSKLRRLGVTKGARNLKTVTRRRPAEPAPDIERDLTKLLPGGRIEHNEDGAYFVVDSVYALHQVHGSEPPSALLDFAPTHLIPYLNCDLPASFRDCLFIDTETTGLAGAGTVAFMVGVGFFEANAFVVRQYFMRDFGDETAMLADLSDLIARFPHLISFNGKTFDIPLLKTRYLMNRLPDPLVDLPHIDLLHPARRIWRRRLGSVALSALEENLLEIGRTQQDVPGFLIPTLYHDYMRTGDPNELLRVFYHNKIDMLSMVTLATRLLQTIVAPDLCQYALDLYSLGKWQRDLGLPVAEAYLRQAASMQCEIEVWHTILLEIGRLLKRQDRRKEAVPLWLQVAHTTEHTIDAHIELAKFYEWHEINLEQALLWVNRAFAYVDDFDVTLHAELNHRRLRLERKLAS